MVSGEISVPRASARQPPLRPQPSSGLPGTESREGSSVQHCRAPALRHRWRRQRCTCAQSGPAAGRAQAARQAAVRAGSLPPPDRACQQRSARTANICRLAPMRPPQARRYGSCGRSGPEAASTSVSSVDIGDGASVTFSLRRPLELNELKMGNRAPGRGGTEPPPLPEESGGSCASLDTSLPIFTPRGASRQAHSATATPAKSPLSSEVPLCFVWRGAV